MNPLTRGVLYACTPEPDTVYVKLGDISDIEISESTDTAIGEYWLKSIAHGTALSMTVKMNRAEIIRFAMATLDVSNNMIRYHGGKPVRFVQLRKLDKCKSK